MLVKYPSIHVHLLERPAFRLDLLQQIAVASSQLQPFHDHRTQNIGQVAIAGSSGPRTAM